MVRNLIFVALASYFMLGMHDTWASTPEMNHTAIQNVEQDYYQFTTSEELDQALAKIQEKSKNSNPKYYLSKLKSFIHLPKKSIANAIQTFKEDPVRWTIIATRVIGLGGFAAYTIIFQEGPSNVVAAYGVSTALMQYYLGRYNSLELNYIAYKMKLNIKKLKKTQWPLYINKPEESARLNQLSKWVSIELVFLAVIESAKAVASPDIDFSMLHILKEVFVTGLLTTWMQEPLDSMNSTYTGRKFESLLYGKNYVTPHKMKTANNWANFRTGVISIYSTVLAFLYLNPESFASHLPVDVGFYMGASGVAYQGVYLTYKNRLYTKDGRKQFKEKTVKNIKLVTTTEGRKELKQAGIEKYLSVKYSIHPDYLFNFQPRCATLFAR